MSILKSTNSGGQKVLTIQDLLERGWYFIVRRSPGTLPLSGGGISGGGITGGPFVDKTKLYYKKDTCWMNVKQEGNQLVLEWVWTYDHEFEGKVYKIYKYVRPRTLLDFCTLEKFLDIEDAQEKIWKLDELFCAGFTDTQVTPIENPIVSGYSGYKAMTPTHSIINPED